MTTQERAEMLQRYDDANRWLVRMFDQGRSVEHRSALWDFLVSTGEKRFRNILLVVRELDEINPFWTAYSLN